MVEVMRRSLLSCCLGNRTDPLIVDIIVAARLYVDAVR